MKNQDVMVIVVFVAASIMSGAAVAKDEAAAKTRARGGVALQLDLAWGGDEITSNTPYAIQSSLGEGYTLAIGGFYRLSESKPWELEALVGHKSGWIRPFSVGGSHGDVSGWVFHLLTNYHYQNKWHVGGGLTYHANPKYDDTDASVADFQFDSAVGATIEAGWSWLGLQCTYIEYGSLDASNCGVRFTWRFRKFGPLP